MSVVIVQGADEDGRKYYHNEQPKYTISGRCPGDVLGSGEIGNYEWKTDAHVRFICRTLFLDFHIEPRKVCIEPIPCDADDFNNPLVQYGQEFIDFVAADFIRVGYWNFFKKLKIDVGAAEVRMTHTPGKIVLQW